MKLYKYDTGLSLDIDVAGIREPVAAHSLINLGEEGKFTGKTFLDIGANLGYYSVLLSKYVDKLVCIEPNKQAIKVLEENITQNTNSTAYTIEPIALGVEGTQKLYMQENKQINLSKVSYKSGDYEIQHATLTELLKKHKPGIIKMDIEGFEHEIFTKLNTDEVNDYMPSYIFIEIHFEMFKRGGGVEVLRKMEQCGYSIHRAIREMKGPDYFGYQFPIWKKFSKIIKKIVLPNHDYILAQDISIDDFITQFPGVTTGKNNAIEFIFMKD